MRYSIRFFRGSRNIHRASEVILKYEEEHEALVDYIDEYTQGQRIVLDICGLQIGDTLDKNLELWTAARDKHNKFAIKLSEEQLGIIPLLKENNLKFFLSTKIDTLDKLSSVILLGVSDAYICNELGFSLKTIGKYCHSRNVNVRVYPNIAQSSSDNENIDNFKKFFIRPEDISIYENFVDYCEFYCDLPDKQDVLYEIYKDERWLGNLAQLILGLEEDIHNPSILPDFADRRLDCGKRCTYGTCETCDRVRHFVKLTDTIEEQSGQRLEVRRDNDKNRDTSIEESNDAE